MFAKQINKNHGLTQTMTLRCWKKLIY